MASGEWYDPYTDQTFTHPSDIETDHVRGPGERVEERGRRVNCDYTRRWIEIKAKYDLSVNVEEKTALGNMLGTCA